MSDSEETASCQDYDALREKNIAERDAFLRKFQKDIDEINKLENQRTNGKKDKVQKTKSFVKTSTLAPPRMQTRSSNKKHNESSSDSDEEWLPNGPYC